MPTSRSLQPASHVVTTVGNDLQRVLDDQKLSRAEAARRSGVHVQVINRILADMPVRRVKALAVAAGLEVSPRTIVPSWPVEQK